MRSGKDNEKSGSNEIKEHRIEQYWVRCISQKGLRRSYQQPYDSAPFTAMMTAGIRCKKKQKKHGNLRSARRGNKRKKKLNEMEGSKTK